MLSTITPTPRWRDEKKRKGVCSNGKTEKEGREEGGEEKEEDHQEAKGGKAPTLNKSLPMDIGGLLFLAFCRLWTYFTLVL